MKITAFKCTEHEEIVTIQQKYEARIRLKPGRIITLVLDVEDDTIHFWQGKTAADRRIIKRMRQEQKSEIDTLLEERGFDE